MLCREKSAILARRLGLIVIIKTFSTDLTPPFVTDMTRLSFLVIHTAKRTRMPTSVW